MPISIGNNIASLQAQRSLAKSNDGLTRVYERVASYNRILQVTKFNGMSPLAVTGSVTPTTLQLGKNGEQLSISIGQDLVSDVANTTTVVGNGTFAAGASIGFGVANEGIEAADLNGDGLADLVVGSTTNLFNILLSNGNGTFSLSYVAGSNASNPITTVTGDFNKDGAVDILQSTNTGKVFVALGNGNGTFKASVSYSNGGTMIYDGAVGDVNGDGNLDFVGSNSTDSPRSVFLFLGNGDGSFLAPTTRIISTGGGVIGLTLGDVNNDGILDIGSAGNTFSGVNLGNGDGTFKVMQNVSASNNQDVKFGDFNDDGMLDVVSTTVFQMEIALGNGNGTFKAASQFAGDYRTVDVGDFNEDGKDDLVIQGFSTNSISVHLSNGNGTFSISTSLSTGYAVGNEFDGLAVGDFGGDGALDIATAGNDTINYIKYFAGNGQITDVLQSTTALDNISLLTSTARTNALTTIDTAFEKIGKELGRIGAYQSRLQVAAATIASTREQYTAAKARIQDVDIAYEASHLTRLQILQRAAGAVLAQANQQPSLAVDLLKL